VVNYLGYYNKISTLVNPEFDLEDIQETEIWARKNDPVSQAKNAYINVYIFNVDVFAM